MAIKPTLSITCIILVLYIRINVVHCDANSGTTTCQGTQCTLEDLQTTNGTNTQLLPNLTAVIATILQNELKIHITHDYKNNSYTGSPQPDQLPLPGPLPRDCTDIFERGNASSGYYEIQITTPEGLYSDSSSEDKPVSVYCDMDTDGGGWTVFQRRINGMVNFYRGWEDYKHGFGYLKGDYWLGLENVHKMTAKASYELRVDLTDFRNRQAYAHYRSQFHVKDEGSMYRLHVGSYRGTARDSLSYNNNKPFTTIDRDHDGNSGNCANHRKGAWWYDDCTYSNLNGLYLGSNRESDTGLIWYHWKSTSEVLKKSEMKIRRVD